MTARKLGGAGFDVLRNGSDLVSSGADTAQTTEHAQPGGGRSDAAMMVVATMRQLGVSGMPRNYELFYEAITAGRRDLVDALSQLGSRPTQQQLDDLANRFLKRGNEAAIDSAHSQIISHLGEIIVLLKTERTSMETYGEILSETSHGLESPQPLSREFLDKIVSITATATRSSIASQIQTMSSIGDKSDELQQVKSQLEEYKRLADTDALTQLHNRRAFDRALSMIYDNNRKVVFSALLLIDIDRFKIINDRFGHPVGDRIIQIVADLIRATVKEDVFVARTGGEEFAIVFEGFGEETVFSTAEQVRQAIMNASFVNVATNANYGPISVSLGICMATEAQNPDDLYAKADRALYASKAAGRNRTTRFSALSDGKFLKNWLLYRDT